MMPLRRTKMFQFILVATVFINFARAAQFTVNTTRPIFKVDPEFVSATLDFMLVDAAPSKPRWLTFDFKSPKVRILLQGLAPCYLRFGGSGADLTVFSEDKENRLYNQPTAQKLHSLFKEDVDKLVELTRSTDTRLLFDFNINVRYYDDWDPTNAESLLSYMASKGYGKNVDFELGNEPASPPNMPLTGKQLGHYYLSFTKLVKSFPDFRQSKIVGADIVTQKSLTKLMPIFLSTAGANISATTFHHYYFNGLDAHPSEYIKPSHFDSVKESIGLVKDLVKKNSPNKDLPIWIGETSDSWHSGTVNVSDRYISGFLWLDKLGLSAQLGVSTIMRQTFYGGHYALIDDKLNPNPDYWLSYLHKTLVGRNVFETTVLNKIFNIKHKKYQTHAWNTSTVKNSTSLIRLYSHCTRESAKYPSGALTVFGLNLKNSSEVVTFDSDLARQPVDQYLLLPGENGLLSQRVELNGNVLRLVDHKLPKLHPISLPNIAKGITFPPHSFGFWVFPKSAIKQCL